MRCLLLALPICLLAPPALADQPVTRDGFFLRLALGGGGLNMGREGRVSAGSSSYYTGSSRISGGIGASELSVGGTLGSGVVLAATLLNHEIGDPKLTSDGRSDLPLDGPLHFVLLGVSLEYFPDPRGGFHFGGTVGVAGAWAKAPDPRWTEYLGGAGGALSLTAGYLWWVSDRWSLGTHLRLTGANLHGEDSALGVTASEDDKLGALAAFVQGTFH